MVRLSGSRVSTKPAGSEDRTEFSLSASYEEWVKIASGTEKIQREITRGRVKFTGSWPRMLMYLGKVIRLENELLRKIGLMSVRY